MRVVAIEEHHIIPEMSSYMDLSGLPPVVQARLRATTGERLADMDAAGIDMQVLSVVLPMAQMLPAETAVPLAEKANGEMHAMVTAHPDQGAGIVVSIGASLGTQRPEAPRRTHPRRGRGSVTGRSRACGLLPPMPTTASTMTKSG